MIKQFLIIFLLLTSFVFSQNLKFESDTTGTNDSIFVDLGVDTDYLQYEYTGGSELRAIGILLQGTWTNDSLQVYAAVHPDSTYYPVYYGGAVLVEVATTGSSYIVFNPQKYAGIRYLLFKLPADEAANRIYWIIRRQY